MSNIWHLQIDNKPACEHPKFFDAKIPCEVDLDSVTQWKLIEDFNTLSRFFCCEAVEIVKGFCPKTGHNPIMQYSQTSIMENYL